MRLWRQLIHGLRTLFGREEADRELSDEVRHYLEEAEAELVARGATREEARRQIRLRYGDGLQIRETVRAYGWESAVEDLYGDVRLTLRRLRWSPGFTLVVTLILGLGIGSAATILSVVSPVLFRALPYPDASRVVAVTDRAEGGGALPVAFGTYLELSGRSRSFDALAAYRPWQPTLTGGTEPERLEGQRVGADYFAVLGVAPVLGPGLDPAADRPGGGNEVVLSDELWRRIFGADPAVIGQTVHLDGDAFVVRGVMPRDFVNATMPSARAWALLQYDPLVADFGTREWGHHLGLVGRVRAPATLDDARRELATIATSTVPEFPRPAWASLEQGLVIEHLRDAAAAPVKPTMIVLLGSVGLLLTIACVNLTILLLARGLRRRGELAMRAALGAGRNRLLRQTLTESLALAALGGALGFLLARVALAAVVAASPSALFPSGAIELDGATLGFVVSLATLVGLTIGSVPALRRWGGSLNAALHDTGQRTGGRQRSLRNVLVVTEISLAVVLAVGAGLLLRSSERLFSTPVGFDPTSLVVMQVSATGLESGDATIHRFWDQVLDAVRNVPGVESAVLTSQLPLTGDADVYGVTLQGPDRPEGVDGAAYRYAVSPGYFETLGMRISRGRALTPDDDEPRAQRVAVVSESLASRLFQEGDPLGRRIGVGPAGLEPYTIVGVVTDVKQESLATDQVDGVYIASTGWHWADRVRWLVIRSEADHARLLPAVRHAIWAVDGDQPIVRTQSMQDVVLRSEGQRRFVMTVLLFFALSALALSALGLYGVLAGSVAERTREIGVRAALGASRDDILSLVIRQGMALTIGGIVIGLVGGAAASASLRSLLFDVARLDPFTYAATAAMVAALALLACWLPAYRAARVDVLTVLRGE